MANRKFDIGDRVQVRDSNRDYPYLIGKAATVTRYDQGYYYITFDEDHRPARYDWDPDPTVGLWYAGRSLDPARPLPTTLREVWA